MEVKGNRLPPSHKRHINRGQCAYCGVTLGPKSILPQGGPRTRTAEKTQRLNDSKTWDHIVPQTAGGKICVPCCSWCNNNKGHRSLRDWINSSELALRAAMVNEREPDCEPMHPKILYQLRDEDLARIRKEVEYHAQS